jgi:C4-dicarboxylate-specific signal transduction histidine kinase
MEKQKTSPQLVQLKEFEYSGTLVFAGISPIGEMIAIRQVCENLGIDSKWQREKLKSDSYFGSVGGMEKIIAKDGKSYMTYCLPAMDLHMWLWNLNPTPNMNLQVWESYKKGLVKHILAMLKISLDKIEEMISETQYVKEMKDTQKQIDELENKISKTSSDLTEMKKEKKGLEEKRAYLLRENPNQLKLSI